MISSARVRLRHGVLLLILTCAGPAGLRAESKLAERLRPLIDAHKGTVAVAVKHLGTGEEYNHRETEPMPTASLIKLAVMVEAYRQADAGTIDLGEAVALREEDKVQGSGILTTHFSAGAKFSLRDAVRLMIAYSDNTATNLVLDRIGLPATAKTMEALGLPNTKIHAKVFRGDTPVFPERSRRFGLGSTTAGEMVRLLELLHKEEVARPESCRAMLEHLRACEDKAGLPRLLPEGTKAAHKTGAVSAVRTDAGIIESPRGPIAVCVLTSENEDRRWSDDNAAKVLCGRIARAAYDHFNSADHGEDAPADTPGELTLGASGWLVEALQRTLNRRASPSPDLSVDGEFGPATRKAVIEFQKSHDLSPTGTVNQETWEALGPVVTADASTGDPEIVAARLPEKSPADTLVGPPFVTCTAWAVGDPQTGEMLHGANQSKRVDMASTTKLMTARVVLRLAENDAAILDELVRFSQRADETTGSTAAVRAGEELPVRDLLYGLLLPSGNDAAIALAEHFGPRCAPSEGESDKAGPVERFVAEMNRSAAELGMADTHYANPHGLPAKGHRTTAHDLLRLACATSRDERLLACTSARQHLGTVTGPGGYRRQVLWKNTNQLLGTDGYLGLKTGTTTSAGACLVSLGERDSRRLIVVVLGSTSDEARYADTRNLFRWAWQQHDALAPPDRGGGP